MARAGFGYLRLIDPDRVEPSNLPRQLLFEERDAAIGAYKATTAAERLHAVNSSISLDPVIERFGSDNAARLLADVDMVLDGSDNFEARYAINDACAARGLPWIYGGVLADSGATMNVLPGGPCLRCLMPSVPEGGSYLTPETAGVINQIVAVIAAIESAEALKLALGSPDLRRGLLSISLWDWSCCEVNVEKAPGCPACGGAATPS